MNNTQYKHMVCIHCMTYNHEKYIADALEGFVMQKTNFPFVAVVIDDFSTDGTADILRKYETKYPDIIKAVYLQENYYSQQKSKKPFLEPYDSQSKYIALCEGDDYWTDPYKLQKQVDFLESHDEYGFIGTKCRLLKTEITEDKDWFETFAATYEGRIKMLGNVFQYAIYGPPTRTCSLMYRKNLLTNFSTYICGDLTLQAILAHDSLFAMLDEFCCVYRIHEGGISNSKSYKGQLLYHQWWENNHRLLHKLFPLDCPFDEVECNDRRLYIHLKYHIRYFKWKEALQIKSQIKSATYKGKRYVYWLRGPITAFLLSLTLKQSIF